MNYLGIDENGVAVSGWWNEDSNAPEGQSLVLASDGADIGWIWNGISWTDPRSWGDKRRERYIQLNQLELIYNDMKNGTTTFVDAIDAIRAAIPKD